MSKDRSDNPNAEPASGNGADGRLTFSQEEVARAQKCFARGQELAEKKNYDYAIHVYISGLEHWPEAVAEGHKPCRAAALFRGKTKVGWSDQMKYRTSGKDARRAMLNAEILLAKDPHSIAYMEALFKNAARSRFDSTVMWIGEILADAAVREAKPSPARFELMRTIYEELADRNAHADLPLAIAAMERAVEAQSRLKALKPNDMAIANDLRDVAGKLTILKGRYSSADSFRDSIHDGQAQAALHDKDRVVQSDDRLDGLIAKAAAEHQALPHDARALNELVELLCRRERQEEETRAIGILARAFKETNEYRYKMRADDIRIKQLRRQGRDLATRGDARAVDEHEREQLRFELGVYKERLHHYPTDMRVRFEYGKRLFQGGRLDDAIPVLQEARNDPKTRFQCGLYIGRCFFKKAYYSQAVDTFREAIEHYEVPDDELGKELHYWLGRAYQADRQTDDALRIYGQIIQWDYNYRKGDVRRRIDELKEKA